MTNKELAQKIVRTKQDMDKARMRGNHKAFNDLKKHYDKLLKDFKKCQSENTQTLSQTKESTTSSQSSQL